MPTEPKSIPDALDKGATVRTARKMHSCNATRSCYVRLGTACRLGEIGIGEPYVEQYGDNGDVHHPDRYHVACYLRVRSPMAVPA